MTEVVKKGEILKKASRSLALASTEDKNAALAKIADGLEKNTQRIINANSLDMENGRKNGIYVRKRRLDP